MSTPKGGSGNSERGNHPRLPQSNEKGHQLADNWLGALGIYDGEWFIGSKLKLQRGMKARCFGEAARIWFCIGLHTEGFTQELAVKRIAGKNVPLQPVDIAAEAGIRKQNIRRGILQLKAYGLADIQGEQHHRIRIFGWVKPRDVDVEAVISEDPWRDVPNEWRSLFRRLKIQPATGFSFDSGYVEDLARASRDYLKSWEVLKSIAQRARGRDPIQRNEKNIERTDGRSAGENDRPTKKYATPDPAEEVELWLHEHIDKYVVNDVPGRSVCLKISQAAGDMPLDNLLPLSVRIRHELEEHGYAALIMHVRHAAQRWMRDAGRRRKAIQQQEAEASERDRKFAEEVMKNPDAGDEQRAWALDVLGLNQSTSGRSTV